MNATFDNIYSFIKTEVGASTRLRIGIGAVPLFQVSDDLSHVVSIASLWVGDLDNPQAPTGILSAGDIETQSNLLVGGKVTKSTAIGARVYYGFAQTISSGVVTELTFTSERFDTDTIHNTTSNQERLTCKTAGIYLITVNVVWNANASGVRNVAIKLNNATIIARDVRMANTSGNTVMSLTTLYQLAVNDYVEVEVFQDSGSAVDINSVSNVSPEFSMVRHA